jgi:uncharacterized membrane protein
MPKSRIEAFSDGVFAIVITLLVLEIKVPSLAGAPSDKALIAALLGELPVIISCAISFFIIAVFWVSHHQFWHSCARPTGRCCGSTTWRCCSSSSFRSPPGWWVPTRRCARQ